MARSLAETLREIRKLRGCSLREVEEATDISNAYLSQLEKGDALKPSPDKLHALAEFYRVPYEGLMQTAGYLTPSAGSAPQASVSAIQSALMTTQLTPEEEEQVVKYIQFLRFQKKK